MAEEIFNKISLVGSDEFFENELNRINFKSNIVLDGFKDKDNISQEIAKKIANLISDSNGYYYIYFNYYSSKKNNDLYTFQYQCSRCRSLAKKPCKVTEEIKNEIKANLHLMPSDIYRRIEHNYPEITQKQIHA
ncbi:16482_t:CDS:2, partial [Dentiscutata heterogama]